MQRQRAVIVAVAAVGAGVDMVQPAIDQIIDMIAMRHSLVTAIGPMHMITPRRRGADIGIDGRNRNNMFIHMVAVDMVEMAVVQIINMVIMSDGGMAASGAVDMNMLGMDLAVHWQTFPKQAAVRSGNRCDVCATIQCYERHPLVASDTLLNRLDMIHSIIISPQSGSQGAAGSNHMRRIR